MGEMWPEYDQFWVNNPSLENANDIVIENGKIKVVEPLVNDRDALEAACAKDYSWTHVLRI